MRNHHHLRRPLVTIAVALISLTAGAYAGRAQVSVESIEVVNAGVVPPSEPALLPVRALMLSEVTSEPVVAAEPSPEPRCDLLEQIHKSEELFAPVKLAVGTKEYRYTEKRAGGEVSFSDPEKQIALSLLDEEHCTLKLVIITKHGDKLIAPSGYDIEVVARVNGIRWNNWATEYRINSPAGLSVISNKYPLVGNDRTVTPVVYTPYSKELHVPEMVAGGREFLTDLAVRAQEELRTRRVPSMTGGNKLIANVSALKPEFTARLVPIELMDLTEFTLDPTWTTERIHVVIGANRDRVASFTCSKAKACGLMQFTEGTYDLMEAMYPEAKLNKDFVSGARMPLNAMKAALLLHDYNLSVLIDSFGASIANDPKLEEYLAAAYNTGVGRVTAVLAAARRAKNGDWAEANGQKDNAHLLPETKGYIAKLRYLRDQWSSPPLAKIVSR